MTDWYNRRNELERLIWERNPVLDEERAKTEIGTYVCIRNWCDVAILWFYPKGGDGHIELRRSGDDGSHRINREFAQKHYMREKFVANYGKF